MKKFFHQAIALAGLMSVIASASGSTGIEMLSKCEQAIRFMDGPKEKITSVMAADASYCMGAVEATTSMLVLHRDLVTEDKAVCMPKISLSQKARVAVKFMTGRPEILHLGSGAVLYLAFHDTYPCNPKI